MKKIFTLCLLSIILLSVTAQSQTLHTAYDQLVYVNEQWKYQPDVDKTLQSIQTTAADEQSLVKFHLEETEKLLRNRDVSKLSPQQQKSRAHNLDILHGYWQKGVFPVNEFHTNRQPYFIDRYNNYCAVGYLMKMTGGDVMAKDINRTQNFSYLADIYHPKLMDWVANSGLTISELQLIQPGYGGEWPSTIVEMHYQNTGDDVNEYIEVHQSNGLLVGMQHFSSLLFYDSDGNLYKTLQIADMTGINNNQEYAYTFTGGEHFADSGKIEIKSANKLLGSLTYNSAGITVEDNYHLGSPASRHFDVAENESTPAGSSITFCGLYATTWQPGITAQTIATLNSCTVGALPVLLAKFDYAVNNKTVALNWQTATETNSSYFTVEKSTDGLHFLPIGKVKAAGNSNKLTSYTFTDNSPAYINYYRLKQADLDGKFAYSKILYTKVTELSPLLLKQNPVKGTLPVQVNINSANINALVIYTPDGRLVKKITVKTGLQNINVANLAAGKYVVQLITNDAHVYSQQLLVER